MKAQEKYDIITRLAEDHITKHTAAVKIGCTPRHINRLLKKYYSKGKESFSHGNTGRKPAHALSEQQKKDIITIYNNQYWDANFTHCCELLAEHNEIKISPSCLRMILYQEFILSPRATRRTKKKMNQILKELHKTAKTKKEKTLIEARPLKNFKYLLSQIGLI